jgi:glycosyltransferase involved in cell wall biosynthesis
VKKVLIITYYWPPSGGAGVQRWLKFAKYLPQTGIEPVILTVDPKYASYPQIDPDLLKDISPGLNVIYAISPTGIFKTYRKLTGREEIPYGGFVNEGNPGLLQQVLRFIRGNFFLPDARRGWNRHALKAASKIIEDNNIDTVITTSPPHSTQLIGLKLKKQSGIQWIADLRDPWTDIYYTGKMFQTIPAKWINRRLESIVLNNADRVIATCNTTRDVFRLKLQQSQSPEKITTITNGFDPDDFVYGKIVPVNFTVTYLGTFAGNYDIGVLIRAIDRFQTVGENDITLRFIGKADEKALNGLKGKIRVSVELIPYVDHRKAMEYLSASAALLLVIPSDRKSNEMIPGKLFEYLVSRRPVIAIGPAESDAGKILIESGGGRIFDKNDSDVLGDYLIELNNNFKRGHYETEPSGIDQYSRKTLAEKYAAIINDMPVHAAAK